MTETLDDYWSWWRGSRARDIRAELGCPVRIALESATYEAVARQQAAKLVGLEAALEATLVTELLSNGEVHTFAKVPLSAIPENKLAAAKSWAKTRTPKMQSNK
tara:strand:+ start:1902 stop:2213 length:312 start_codon:yes stop_codon:yes gene_type:complete